MPRIITDDFTWIKSWRKVTKYGSYKPNSSGRLESLRELEKIPEAIHRYDLVVTIGRMTILNFRNIFLNDV